MRDSNLFALAPSGHGNLTVQDRQGEDALGSNSFCFRCSFFFRANMSLTEDRRKVADIAHNVLLDSMASLNAAHGCKVEHLGSHAPAPNAPGAQWVFTTVQFSGLGLRGSLLLAATQKDAHALWPLNAQNTNPTGEDMVGEFANCLLGSLQTRLCHEAIEISMSTPQTTRGLAQSVLEGSHKPGWEQFKVRTAEVFTKVSVEITSEFLWQPLATDGDPPLGEGGCIVF